MIVQAAPNATCRNSSGQSLLAAIATIRSDEGDRDRYQALARDDLEVEMLGAGGRRQWPLDRDVSHLASIASDHDGHQSQQRDRARSSGL